MESWEDMTLVGKPEFIGVRPDATGLNIYDWKLSRTPEEAWVQVLGSEMSLSTFHPMPVTGDTVRLTPPEAQLQAYADHLRAKIASANTKYRSVVLPRITEREEQVARRAEEEQARARRAQDEAAALSLGDEDHQ